MAVPYGSAAAVTDVNTHISTLDTHSNKATFVNIRNRTASAKSFDVSWDGGTTFISRLDPGVATSYGGANCPILVSSVVLKCSEAGGTATAEVTCVAG